MSKYPQADGFIIFIGILMIIHGIFLAPVEQKPPLIFGGIIIICIAYA